MEEMSKAEVIARYIARMTRAGKKIAKIRSPQSQNKDNEEARRRRQIADGFLTESNRGVVEVK